MIKYCCYDGSVYKYLCYFGKTILPLYMSIAFAWFCVCINICVILEKKLYTSSTQQQTISVCVIVVCMPSPLYLAVCNPCMSVPFFYKECYFEKNYTSFTQQTISVRGIVACTPLYLASLVDDSARTWKTVITLWNNLGINSAVRSVGNRWSR